MWHKPVKNTASLELEKENIEKRRERERERERKKEREKEREIQRVNLLWRIGLEIFPWLSSSAAEVQQYDDEHENDHSTHTGHNNDCLRGDVRNIFHCKERRESES